MFAKPLVNTQEILDVAKDAINQVALSVQKLGDFIDPNPFPQVADNAGNYNNVTFYSNAVTFTPQVAAVPGPLPILGAASALGWSRRVRSRLRNAQRSAR